MSDEIRERSWEEISDEVQSFARKMTQREFAVYRAGWKTTPIWELLRSMRISGTELEFALRTHDVARIYAFVLDVASAAMAIMHNTERGMRWEKIESQPASADISEPAPTSAPDPGEALRLAHEKIAALNTLVQAHEMDRTLRLVCEKLSEDIRKMPASDPRLSGLQKQLAVVQVGLVGAATHLEIARLEVEE